jgi:molybdate transport system regulatory protein
MNVFVVRSKIWLEANGHPFLGDGRYRLLQAVERRGSINAAARDMGISYRKAWAQLQAMEESVPFPLLIRKVGGKYGGSSKLTPEIKQLMRQFEKMRDRIKDETERCCSECFKEAEQPS